MKKKLTAKEQAFCNYYLDNFNATAAAKKAGYSEKTATVIGYENLTKPHIKSYIKKRVDQIIGAKGLTMKKRLIQGFEDIAYDLENNNGDRLRAMESLSKYIKLWDETPQVVNNYNIMSELVSNGIKQAKQKTD